MKAIAINLRAMNDYKAKVIGIFFIALVALSFMYAYFINETVMSVASRNQVESDNSVLATEVAELESKFISGESAITVEYARELGFVEAPSVIYIARAGSASSLSFNNAERQ